jgi:hypothetical protein
MGQVRTTVRFSFDSHRNVPLCPSPPWSFHIEAAVFPNEASRRPPPKRQAATLNSYRPALRNYLLANHFVDSFEFHSISGRDIIEKFGYRACSGK